MMSPISSLAWLSVGCLYVVSNEENDPLNSLCFFKGIYITQKYQVNYTPISQVGRTAVETA